MKTNSGDGENGCGASKRVSQRSHELDGFLKVLKGGARPLKSQASNRCSTRKAQEISYAGPVRSFTELQGAFRLVHDQYVSLSYMLPNESGMRYSIYELLPNTMTFITMQEEMVTGTVSVVTDSFSGLPLGGPFKNELNTLRAAGRQMAEGTMFASSGTSQTASPKICLELVKWAFGWCCIYGIDDLCIVVNPRHRGFWEQVVGFEILASPRACQHVEDAPGVLMRLNVEAILARTQEMSRFLRNIFRDPTVNPAAYIDDYRPNEQEMSDLLLWQPEICQNLNRYQLAVMERFYPLALRLAEGKIERSLFQR